MNDKIYTIDDIKKVVCFIAKKYGVDKVYLFGSYARGNARPDSDIDLRIDRGIIKSHKVLKDMHNELIDAFDKSIHFVLTQNLDDNFLRSIAREEILLFESDLFKISSFY